MPPRSHSTASPGPGQDETAVPSRHTSASPTAPPTAGGSPDTARRKAHVAIPSDHGAQEEDVKYAQDKHSPEKEGRDADDDARGDVDVDDDVDEDEEEHREKEMRMKKLMALLARSGIYSKIMAERMAKERAARAQALVPPAVRTQKTEEKHQRPTRSTRSARIAQTQLPQGEAEASQRATLSTRTAQPTRKRRRADLQVSDFLNEDDLANAGSEEKRPKRSTDDVGDVVPAPSQSSGADPDQPLPDQPALVTGAVLRDYQLEGVAWLVSLYENGLNGILADEMGLGKTLQTISFFAHLRAHGVWGPFLVVAPLSTIYNWETELKRFTPDIPALVYHGPEPKRKELQQKFLQLPSARQVKGDANLVKFPVVITSYEIVLRDHQGLSQIPWKYVVVDEGHRLKNWNSRLAQELRTYQMAQRLILTGTPLQNNLSELWSLLNFILPDIFDDLDTFEEWFDFDDEHNTSAARRRSKNKRSMSRIQTKEVVSQLHAILKPFMLRRIKTDVEQSLPPKQEYLLYTRLTPAQVELYNATINGTLRTHLISLKTGLSGNRVMQVMAHIGAPEYEMTATPTAVAEGSSDETISARRLARPRRRAAQNALQVNFDERADDELGLSRRPTPVPARGHPGGTRAAVTNDELVSVRQAMKEVRALKLENLVMQLRKVCNHPYLFHWPTDDANSLTLDGIGEASGKMRLLERLLPALLKRGHRVLIFSQFSTMLNILQAWIEDRFGTSPCRIDGSYSGEDRRRQMDSFNAPKSAGGGIFILSTRAGGLGINLASADTVIFFDSDWNPAADAQAQDRAHRIGQTKPVLVFRLAAANTVEQRILNSAQSKRQLEELVISQGKRLESAAFSKQARIRDLVRLDDDGELGSDFTSQQLETLLDRSGAAMARPLGWSLGSALVTEMRGDNTSDAVARMMADEA